MNSPTELEFYREEIEHEPVPDSIEFGSNCFVFPSWTDCGLPEIVGQQVGLRPRAQSGSWVKRGEALLTAFIPYLTGPKQPPWWMFWKGDGDSRWSIDIKSPVSGLLLGGEFQRTAYFGERTHTKSGYPLTAQQFAVLPILLLPKSEPAPAPDVDHAYDMIASSLKSYYARLIWSDAEGYKALPDVLQGGRPDSVQDPYRQQAQDWFSEPGQGLSVPPCIRSFGEVSRATTHIASMRANDTILRDKLKHMDESRVD